MHADLVPGSVATPPSPLREAEAALADDPDPDADLTVWSQAADGRRIGRSHFQLTGLWCAGCAGVIEAALAREPGVQEARVSYATQRASVIWEPAATRLSSLLGAVRRAQVAVTAQDGLTP